jgi:protocatechuate 3,4-dioxygenase beta subunit
LTLSIKEPRMTDWPDDEQTGLTRISRDRLLKLAGAAGVSIATAGAVRGPLAALGAQPADAAALACVLSPEKTEGPYFVDERLNRSDIRIDSSNGSVQPGVPLRLTITVYDVDNACAPVPGAAVDIWDANAEGLYSDVSANRTGGRKYLRGYQVADANGAVQFTTVYPGWYSGRAIHIHFKIRKFDGSSATYEFTSQIFFDESINQAVLAQGPYSSRGQADTPNSADNIYGTDGGDITAAVAADGSGGYAATFAVGVTGLAGAAGGAPTDTSVTSALSGARFSRNSSGTRVLTLTLAVDETVTADVRLVRGARTLVRRAGALQPGTRRIALAIPASTSRGPARLRLTLRDAAGNTRVIQRSLQIPRRG